MYIFIETQRPVKVEYQPNKLDLSNWDQNQQQQHQQSVSNYSMSKDGVQNLKSKFYEAQQHQQQPQNSSQFYNQPARSSNTNFSNQSQHQSPYQSDYEQHQAQFRNSASNSPQISKVRLHKLSSHDNYLFNNKNAVNVLRNVTNNENESNEADLIASSDL